MDFYQSLSGMREGELTAAQPEQVLVALNKAGIVLYQVESESMLTFRVRLRSKDWKRSQAVCVQNGAKLEPVGQQGLYYRIRALLRRPVLVVGLSALVLFILYLPTKVLFVRVEGNKRVPANQIIEAAESCGIRFWADRREVRSEKMKNSLLSALPQLQWAGVNTAGCVATISVREGQENITVEKPSFSSMVAQRDGFVFSATATRGNLLVQPGQTVKKGQLLISGYEDCGICIRATGAEGEIFAETLRTFEAVTLRKRHDVVETGEEKKKISLLLGKKRINLWKDSGISLDSCGRMYEEYYVTLPGGFRLPAAICVERYRYREEEEVILDQETAALRLRKLADTTLSGQMIAGEVLNRSESVTQSDGCWRITGSYVCREMIGRLRQETEWRNEWENQLNGSSASSG